MKKKSFIVLIGLLLSFILVDQVTAQKRKKQKSNAHSTFRNSPNSKDPGTENTRDYAPKSKMRSSKKNPSFAKQLDLKVDEYHQRMKDNAKRYQKMARIAKKPQYSDPSYFGHKRKPKKRAPGKKKHCKECLIVH